MRRLLARSPWRLAEATDSRPDRRTRRRRLRARAEGRRSYAPGLRTRGPRRAAAPEKALAGRAPGARSTPGRTASPAHRPSSGCSGITAGPGLTGVVLLGRSAPARDSSCAPGARGFQAAAQRRGRFACRGPPPSASMGAAFRVADDAMRRSSGDGTAFSIDSLIGSPPQPSPGHFVYTGYPMFMPYRPVVLPPPPPPPALPKAALQPGAAARAPAPPDPQPAHGFCSSLAQGMALTSTLMAALPGGCRRSPQHQEAAAARKFAPQQLPGGGGNFDKAGAASRLGGRQRLLGQGGLAAGLLRGGELCRRRWWSRKRARPGRGGALAPGSLGGTEGMGPCPCGTPAPGSPSQRSWKMRPSCARGVSAGTGMVFDHAISGEIGGGVRGRTLRARWPASARGAANLSAGEFGGVLHGPRRCDLGSRVGFSL